MKGDHRDDTFCTATGALALGRVPLKEHPRWPTGAVNLVIGFRLSTFERGSPETTGTVQLLGH